MKQQFLLDFLLNIQMMLLIFIVKCNVDFLRSGEIVSRILQWKQKNVFVLEMESDWTNLEFIFIEIFEYFFTFEPIKLQVIKSNKFRTNPISKNLFSTLLLESNQTDQIRIIFHRIFQIFHAFRINQIANYWIEQISKKFLSDSTPILSSVLFMRDI